jgi:hypothetical protein
MTPSRQDFKPGKLAGSQLYERLKEGQKLIFVKSPANICLVAKHCVTLRQATDDFKGETSKPSHGHSKLLKSLGKVRWKNPQGGPGFFTGKVAQAA